MADRRISEVPDMHVPPQELLAKPSLGLPSVKSLLASTALLLSQTADLDRSYSKLSTLSPKGSQDLTDKLSHHNSGLERQLTISCSSLASNRLVSPLWATAPEQGRSNDASQLGSPLIRAGRSHECGSQTAREAEPQPRRGRSKTSKTETSILGRAPAHGPARKHKDIRTQLNKLKSSIRALQDSISPQAARRSEAGTRIPRPQPVAKLPESKQSPRPWEEPSSPATMPEEVEVSDFEDGPQARQPEEWQNAAEHVRSSVSGQPSKEEGGKEYDDPAIKCHDPAPAVSALFESLWDTDDQNQPSVPLKRQSVEERSGHDRDGLGSLDDVWNKIVRPGHDSSASRTASTTAAGLGEGCPRTSTQAPKKTKGAHKKSAESGTLSRKMRGLEDAWKQLESVQSKRGSGAQCQAEVEVPAAPEATIAQPESSGPILQEVAMKLNLEVTAVAASRDSTLKQQAAAEVAVQGPDSTTAKLTDALKCAEEQIKPRPAEKGLEQSFTPNQHQDDTEGCRAIMRRSVGAACVPSQAGVAAELHSSRGQAPSIQLPLPESKPKKGARFKFWKPSKTHKAAQGGEKQVQRSASVIVASSSLLPPQAGHDASPEKPAKSKDSFSKLTGLFRRASFTATASEPLGHSISKAAPLTARPARQEQALGTSPSAQQDAKASDFTGCSAQAAHQLKKGKPRVPSGDGGGSTEEAWVSNDQAVKHLLVPNWVPSSLPQDSQALHAMQRLQTERAEGLNESKPQGGKWQLTCEAEAGPSGTQNPVEASASTQGEAESWMSPERAIKNLLVPPWVPNKLPMSQPPVAGFSEESTETPAPAQQDLIAAISPQQGPVMPRGHRPEWNTTKIPFSDMGFAGAATQRSRITSLASMPATVPENEATCGPGLAALLPETAFDDDASAGRILPATTLPSRPACSLSRGAAVQGTSSLPVQKQLDAPADRLCSSSRLPNSKPSAPTPVREGFFRSLFRRRSETGKKEAGPAEGKAAEARRVSDGGALPVISFRQIPPATKSAPLTARTAKEVHGMTAPRNDEPTSTVAHNESGRPQPRRDSDSLARNVDSERSEAAGPPPSKKATWESEFSFHVPAAIEPDMKPATARSRTPSTGRRRLTDDDLDSLQRSFKHLEETFEQLPSRTASRERQRTNLQPRPTCAATHERTAVHAPLQASSATGTAEAVPFCMRKLPSPANDGSAPRSFRRAQEGHEPVVLTTSRWVESLRSPERLRHVSRRTGKTPEGKAAGHAKVAAGVASLPVPDAGRAVSPFGRVRCDPNRAVPFTSAPSPEQGAAVAVGEDEVRVARVEQQLKQSAGAEEASMSPQWRLIAERAVNGPEVSSCPEEQDAKPFEGVKSVRRQINLFAQTTQQSMTAGLHTGGEPRKPRPQAAQEPVVVDSTRPAFPALKAYLRAKSPTRTLGKKLNDDPEIAACSGVSALQRRFEGGLLLEGNVAALQRQFGDPGFSRDRTAAWARQHAV